MENMKFSGGVVVAIAIVVALGLGFFAFAKKPAKAPTANGGNGIVAFQSGIHGTITLGPTCPVVHNQPTPGCADTPYQTMVVVFRASDPVNPFAIATSTADGAFSFSLPPGDYTLGAGESNHPQCTHPRVTVPATGYASTTITCDTGIR